MSIKEVIRCIKNNKDFLITTHKNPEADALGSELAFYLLLKSMGKTAYIVNDDILPLRLRFLPYAHKVTRYKQNSDDIKFDCMVVLDCSDLERTGRLTKLANNKKIINIDHHISNSMFGDINWVEPAVSSTSEMIYKLYKESDIPLDKDVATLLYVGILTDTGSFRFANTTSSTHRIVSELLSYSLDVRSLYKNIYEDIPFDEMKIFTRLLKDIRRDTTGKIVWFKINKRSFREGTLSFDVTEELLKFARAIKGVEIAVLFKESPRYRDNIRVNFRSQGKIDVNKIAAYFGGGGHREASGADVAGNLNTVIKKVLHRIHQELNINK